MFRRVLLGWALLTASTLIGSASAAAASTGAQELAGRYAGAGVWLFVGAPDRTQVQDMVVRGPVCSGGGPTTPIVIDEMNDHADGSFSYQHTEDGIVVNNNTRATYVITLNGTFEGSNTGRATGSYVETTDYAVKGIAKSCTTGTVNWSATRETPQPRQDGGVGAPGSYTLTESQNGNGGSFVVSADRSEVDITLNLASFGCLGGAGLGGKVFISSVSLTPTGSTFTANGTGTFPSNTATVDYNITLNGHFHGVDSTGASRVAGSYDLTGSASAQNGTEYHCKSNTQWWNATSAP